MSSSPAGLRRSARIDLDAFARNLTALLGRDDSFVLDARADAFGHGAQRLVPLALSLGVGTVRVSPGADQLVGIKRSSLMTVAPKRRLVGAEAYGIGFGSAVMTLVGEVIAVKPTEAGAGVSYGYSYRTSADTTLVLVALGYADGVPRLASNRASVSLGDTQYPLVGRVAMDQFVVDSGAYAPGVGSDAVLFGDAAAGHPSVSAWAEHTQRAPLDVTAGVASRVAREYS